MSKNLKYTDERDRALGLAGMTIALAMYDAADWMLQISLDTDPGEGMCMSPQFAAGGNPALSATAVWRSLVKRFEVSAAILAANPICRWYVGRGREVPSDTAALVRALVRDEGRNVCALEDDEIDTVHTRVTANLRRVFAMPAVAAMAAGLADRLQTARTLSAADATEIMARYNA